MIAMHSNIFNCLLNGNMKCIDLLFKFCCSLVMFGFIVFLSGPILFCRNRFCYIKLIYFFWPQPLSLQIRKECVLTENVTPKIILELIFRFIKDLLRLKHPASVYFKFYAMLLLSVCSPCTIVFVCSHCTVLMFVAQTTTSCILLPFLKQNSLKIMILVVCYRWLDICQEGPQTVQFTCATCLLELMRLC